LSQHDVVIDHLTWVDTFLGAHSVGTLIHNDSMEALGRHHDTFDDTSLQMRPMLLNPLTAVFVSNGDRLSTLGAADLLVFHIESFCIHTADLTLLSCLVIVAFGLLVGHWWHSGRSHAVASRLAFGLSRVYEPVLFLRPVDWSKQHEPLARSSWMCPVSFRESLGLGFTASS